MKLKEIERIAVVTVLAIAFFTAALLGVNHFAFATTLNTIVPLIAVEIHEEPPIVTVQSAALRLAATDEPTHIPFEAGSFSIVDRALLLPELVPSSAMPMEDAAMVGAEYIWDMFGASIEGKYVIMNYSECWIRPGRGLWIGNVVTGDDTNMYWNSPNRDGSWRWGEVIFSFTIDAVTGERRAIHYSSPRGNHAPRMFAMDTHSLWETEVGQALLNKNGFEIADFIGLPRERIDAYRQDALALGTAQFPNSRVIGVELGMTFSTSSGSMRMPGVHIVLDRNDRGEIVGTFDGIDFTVTDEHGTEAIVSISEWMGFRSIGVRIVEHPPQPEHPPQAERVAASRGLYMPEHMLEMWAEDDAEVARLHELSARGVSPDDMPPYALWTRWELIEILSRSVVIEQRHIEMTREELATRASVSSQLDRFRHIDAEHDWESHSFFDWVRDNYTAERIAIYVELGAPQWLVDRLWVEIS